jgi:hypothetical protein
MVERNGQTSIDFISKPNFRLNPDASGEHYIERTRVTTQQIHSE